MKLYLPFLCLVLAAAPGISAQTSTATEAGRSTPYFFFNFEAPVYSVGLLKSPSRGLTVLQGKAEIAAAAKSGSKQHLVLKSGDPYSAVLLKAPRFAGAARMYLELWIKPSATKAEAGEEFLDFDGAPVGFFSTEDKGLAELHVFHQTTSTEGVWLSTGQHLRIDDSGVCLDWHRLNLEHDLANDTWSLAVDGVYAIAGVRRSSAKSSDAFECWLFGQSTGDCAFDDWLIASVPPDELEAAILVNRSKRLTPRPQPFTGNRKLSSDKQPLKRRQQHVPQPGDLPQAKPDIGSFKVTVIGGGRHLAETKVSDQKGKPQRYAFYAPEYDEQGKPLPLKVEIRCDEALRRGVDLTQIQWAITELRTDANANKQIPVLVHGTFATGPTQVGQMPSEWSKKPLSVFVGMNLLVPAQTEPR